VCPLEIVVGLRVGGLKALQVDVFCDQGLEVALRPVGDIDICRSVFGELLPDLVIVAPAEVKPQRVFEEAVNLPLGRMECRLVVPPGHRRVHRERSDRLNP
jgi:hypothetical protein